MSNRELKFMKNAKTLKNIKKNEENETGTGNIETNVLNEELSTEIISLPVSNEDEEETPENNDIMIEYGRDDDEKQNNNDYTSKIDEANDEPDVQYVTIGDICLKGKLFWTIIYRICMLILMLIIIIILLSR